MKVNLPMINEDIKKRIKNSANIKVNIKDFCEDENKIKLESKQCPLGCPPDDKILFAGWDRLHNLPGRFEVVRCQTCDLIRTNPRPTLDTIGFYYPDNYGPYLVNVKQDYPRVYTAFSKHWLKELISSIVEKIIDPGSTRLPRFKLPGRALEVGCSSGKFLFLMKNKGWETWGIELAQKPVNFAREVLGLNVIQGVAEKMEFPEETFDLVVAWMVIEHLHDPLEALKRIARSLKNGGYFAFSIPNAGSWEFKFFNKYWYGLHLPNHLHHFTITSIDDLLKKVNLQIERVIYQRCLRNIIGSLGFFLLDTLGDSRIAKSFVQYPEKGKWYTQLILSPVATLMAVLKQSGRITIWARKL